MNEIEKLQKQLKKLDEQGITSYKISQQTGIAEATLSKIKRGLVPKPNTGTVNLIEKFIHDLNDNERKLVGLSTMNRDPQKIGDNEFITVSSTNIMIVPLVEQDAQHGFIDNHSDPDFLADLPIFSFTVDKFHKGKYFSFTVSGDSMDNGTKESIEHRSIVVAREIQQSLWKSRVHLSQFSDFVVVSKEGIMIKRISNIDQEENTITFTSLNPDKDKHPDTVISLDRINMLLNIINVSVQK